MTKTIINGAKIRGSVRAIPSKSYAHRIAICDFLANKAPEAQGTIDFTSADISATKRCVLALQTGEMRLDCGESGSTLRFLIPLALSLGGEYELYGHGRLIERPNDELFDCLRDKGIEIYKKDGRIVARGRLSTGEYRIRGDISSQYISGLLMALASLNGDSRITLTTPLLSRPYVDITIEVLKKYGIEIGVDEKGFVIPGGGTFRGDVRPEGDWSNAAFFLVLGALCGEVCVTGLNLQSVQGDRVILDILKRAGAVVEEGEDFVRARESSLIAFEADATDCPDLVPIISVLAAFAKGTSVIKNIARLKIKESDRVASTIAMLKGFCIKAEEVNNSLVIYGGEPHSGIADSYNDHRIAMAAAVLATAVLGESIVTDSRAVDKSYPTFYEDLRKIGGIAYEVQ